MPPTSQVRKCAHPGCQCLVSEEADYCSEYCKLAATEEYCGCGHAGCNLHFAAPPQPHNVA